jgi:stage II sporulation protein P
LQKTYRYKPRGAAAPRFSAASIPLAVKGLALLFLFCVVIRLFSALGPEAAPQKYMSGLAANDSFVDGILDFELGGVGRPDSDISLMSMILDPSILTPDTPVADVSSTIPAPPSAEAEIAGDIGEGNGVGLYYNDWRESEDNTEGNTENKPNIIMTPNTSPDYIAVNNQTDYTVDTAALLKEPLDITLSGDSPAVLVLHTHGSEAYMPDGDDQYVESDYYRTQDKAQSIIRVGDELCSELAKRGIAFIHDRNVYDYPSYSGCYNRAYEAIQAYLKEYPSIKIVIDMHRDAIEDKEGNVYRTIAQVGDTTCAQAMFVMGTNFSGLEHPNWKENFKLALHIQDEMNTLYPSLAKPIKLSQYRFNQQATTGSMIIEVGSIGNTLQEALTAVRYFADALSNVVLGLYE